MKYIILRAPDGEAPVLFPRTFLHSYVAEIFRPLDVVAAGFVGMAGGTIECYGVSRGLGIRSRPGRDTTLVAAALNDGASAASRSSPVDAPPVEAGEALPPLSKDAGRR